MSPIRNAGLVLDTQGDEYERTIAPKGRDYVKMDGGGEMFNLTNKCYKIYMGCPLIVSCLLCYCSNVKAVLA